VSLVSTIDDHMLQLYRELLDAEDAAFDELEHAWEDGDRSHFETDFATWQRALSRKVAFLRHHMGVDVEAISSAAALQPEG
jgi:hypothetical protein